MLSSPYMNSYRVQVHVEVTQVGFSGRILLWGFHGLVWPFALRRLGVLVAFNGLLVFFGLSPPPYIWKFPSEVSRCSHNSTSSVSPCVEESNPWMISYCCQSPESENYTSSRISYSGRHFPSPKGKKFLRYSTISSIRKINYLIYVSQVLYNPLRRSIFWCWSAFYGNKWAIKSFMTNS